MLHSLLYVSSATTPFSSAQLEDLLRVARANNMRLDITGMLLYKDGNFMQVLEGEAAAVKALFAKIAVDPRHSGAIVLLDGPTPVRAFSEWSMGFRDLRAGGATDISGYTPFLNTPLTSGEFVAEPSRAQKLLLMFKEKM